ncbi:hypothetical protein GmHk_05G013389 [Glycine max]|nr:hypothetical protein GmHk_05G013389 [Glycine max]
MVRVVHLWMVSDISTNKQTSSIKIPFYMETMLVDSKGDTVHGFVKRTLIYKFDKNLQEGKVTTHHKYIIVFQYFTKVVLVDNASVPNFVYDCVPIRDIVCGVYDNKIHLQNCIYGARVVFNAECEKAKELATRMFESPSQGLSQIIDSTALSMLEDFLHNTARKTIGGLKDCFEDTCFAVFGTVKHVVDDEEWCYTACTCNKTVYPDSKMYRIKVHVIDESNSTNFVTFDRDATILFSKSCANMFETYHKKNINGCFSKSSDFISSHFISSLPKRAYLNRKHILRSRAKQSAGKRATKNNKNTMANAPGNDDFLRDAMIGAFTTFDFFLRELIDKQGRVSKVKLLENDKDSIVIYKGWPEFRRLNEIYYQREIRLIYVGDRKFHVRFFKGDPELARVFQQLQEKIQELLTLMIEDYQRTNGEGGIVKTCSMQARK